MEKIKHITLLVILSMGLSCSSCENLFDKGAADDDRLQICNNSNREIYYYFSNDYPDTTLFSYNVTYDPKNYKVNIEECKTALLPWRKWENEFERIESDTLLIFIFDAEILEHPDHEWERTRYDHKGVLRMYKFLYDDLVNMDWKVEYP